MHKFIRRFRYQQEMRHFFSMWLTTLENKYLSRNRYTCDCVKFLNCTQRGVSQTGESESFLVNLASSRVVVVGIRLCTWHSCTGYIYRYIEMPGRCAHRDHSIIRARARVAARRRPSTPVRAQTWLAKQPSFFDRPRTSFSRLVSVPRYRPVYWWWDA